MIIPEVKYHKPSTLEEAYEILTVSDNPALIAGGTDILVEMKKGLRNHNDLVSLNHIKELKTISEFDNFISIGAAVSFNQILASSFINEHFPVLSDAVSKIGSHQVRNTGTIGGNICTCASCADSVPVLIVYDAEIELGSSVGTRRMKITDFQLHHHQTSINQNEVLTRVIIKKQKKNFFASFQKFGLRESASISVASIAAGLSIEEKKIKESVVVSGACSPTPVICSSAVDELNGKNISEITKTDLIQDIADCAAKDISPIDDIRGSAEYRRDIIRVLTKRLILDIIKQYENTK